MPLVINDPETIAALARLAAERGTTEEQVVRDLATSAGANEAGSARESGEEWLARVRAKTKQMRAGLREPFASADVGDMLYDEHGLPK